MSIIPSILSLRTTAIVSATTLAIGTVGGWVLHDRIIYQPHLAADLKRSAKIADATSAISDAGRVMGDALRERADAQQAEVQAVTNTIVKEVPRYVSVSGPCVAAPGAPDRVIAADVTIGFSLLHDYAAAGVAPPASPVPGIDLDAPANIGMPQLAGTIARNYGVCHAAIAENDKWHEYARSLTAWWADANKTLAKAAR